MRGLTTRKSIEAFIADLAKAADRNAEVYFTGGVTAVLSGWRESTIDIDLVIVPESDKLFREIPKLKERLSVNVELACPSHFIPELPDWKKRNILIETRGLLSFYHYDPVSQALAKIERGHAQDKKDVAEMLKRGLITIADLQKSFESIEPQLYRFPAIDPAAFRSAVENVIRSQKG